MAVSDISGATSGANLGATQVTGVQRVEQRQLEAAGQTGEQEDGRLETSATEQTGVTAQAAETGEDRTAENTPRGSLLDITV